MTEDKYSRWSKLCKKTAYWIAKDFPEVDWEDLYQDLLLYVLSNDKLDDPNKYGMSTALARKARYFAWKYRKQSLYLSPQYCYRISDIKRILEGIFLDETWTETYLPEDQKTYYDDDRLVANSDIKYAFERLPNQYQQIVYRKYAMKQELTTTENRQLHRAVERMADILNFYNKKYDYEGIGNKKLRSNAYERYILGCQENGL